MSAVGYLTELMPELKDVWRTHLVDYLVDTPEYIIAHRHHKLMYEFRVLQLVRRCAVCETELNVLPHENMVNKPICIAQGGICGDECMDKWITTMSLFYGPIPVIDMGRYYIVWKDEPDVPPTTTREWQQHVLCMLRKNATDPCLLHHMWFNHCIYHHAVT